MDVKTELQTGVALVAKAFQILDAFQASAPTWTQAEMVRATGLNRSTVNRLMRYLASIGYLMQNANTGRYSLGAAAIELGSRANASFDLRALCKPVMESLAVAIGETVMLTAYDPMTKRAVCVDQIIGSQRGLRVFEEIGSVLPLHAGAAPRAILAFLPQEEQNRILAGSLERWTAHSLTDPAILAEENRLTRERGYSVSNEETYEGTSGVAAPIIGPSGWAVGSIAVVFPLLRVNRKLQQEFGRLLTEAAARVSRDLTGGAR